MKLSRFLSTISVFSGLALSIGATGHAEEAAIGPFTAELCADCLPSSYTIESPEGPVEIVLVRPVSAAGETMGASYVALSWYANGVLVGDTQLDAEGVRDLVANSVAASIGGAARNFQAGTLQIGDESVTAVAVTASAGVTARTGAIARGTGILVVTSVIRSAEPTVAAMTAMLQTIEPANDAEGEEE